MALLIEQVSPTLIWIHDGATNIMEIDSTNGVRINSTFKIGTDIISPSASELAAIDGLTASSAELNLIDGSIAGTAVASKAAALGANKELDEVHAVALYTGAGAGTLITPTAAEINKLAGVAGGTVTASKVVVAGTSKELDEVHAVALYTGAGAGTLISPTAAQINLLAQGVGVLYKIARSAAPVALDGANPTSVAHGLTTCLSATVQLVGSAAPGVGTSELTCVINGANIDVYGWKVTSSVDNTLIASTGTETFNWFAVGT